MTASEIFRKEWDPIISDVIGFDSTQGNFDTRPPLPSIPPNLDWLPPLPREIEREMAGHRPDVAAREDYARRARKISAEAETSSIELPVSFVRLIHSFDLQNRIPSCSADRFDLPPSLLASPFRDGDWILRFLNDQQDVACEYLYLPADDTPFVIASFGLDELPFLEEIRYSSATVVSQARDATAYIAPNFDEFLYRYWLENTIWFKLYLKLPLNESELNYVRYLNPSFQHS